MSSTFEKLDLLAELRKKRAQNDGWRDRSVHELIPASIQEKIDQVTAAHNQTEMVIDETIKQLTDEITAEVIAVGASVTGALLQAVYSKPRVTWDSAKLEGYALAHPEITACRHTGSASVSIREVKEKK